MRGNSAAAPEHVPQSSSSHIVPKGQSRPFILNWPESLGEWAPESPLSSLFVTLPCVSLRDSFWLINTINDRVDDYC